MYVIFVVAGGYPCDLNQPMRMYQIEDVAEKYHDRHDSGKFESKIFLILMVY